MDSAGFVAAPGFFLSVRVLSRLFRRLFLEQLWRRPSTPESCSSFLPWSPFAIRRAFADRIWLPREGIEWVVYAKRPFAGPRQVLDYVGRYTHRVAISNNRLIDIDNGQVTFHWKDYRDDSQIENHGRWRQTNSSADSCSMYCPMAFSAFATTASSANRYRRKKLALCRQLLGMPASSQTTQPRIIATATKNSLAAR